jgi:uncharacterized protein YndB with AHSA1/START domain
MVDVDAQIEAVERAVQTLDVDGSPSRVQTLTQTYASPIDDVWDAVTNAERIGRWFLPLSGDLRIGGTYQLEGNASGSVQACEPPSETGGPALYRVTWEYGGGVTWLTVRLEAIDPGHTKLELEHVARVADVPDELWRQFGPAGTGIGWDQGLLGLGLHLAAPDARPDNIEVWNMGDEGRRFMRRSADAWAAAQANDGIDPEVAAAAAEATFRMYTGEAPGPMG